MSEVRRPEEWQKLGEYCYRIEHDLLRWKTDVLLRPEEVDGVMEVISQVNGMHGYCLMLAPTGDYQQRPEVRRAMVNFLRERSDIRISVAILGGSGVLMRAAAALALGALRVAGAMPRVHVSFFDSASAADAWLSAERKHWKGVLSARS